MKCNIKNNKHPNDKEDDFHINWGKDFNVNNDNIVICSKCCFGMFLH